MRTSLSFAISSRAMYAFPPSYHWPSRWPNPYRNPMSAGAVIGLTLVVVAVVGGVAYFAIKQAKAASTSASPSANDPTSLGYSDMGLSDNGRVYLRMYRGWKLELVAQPDGLWLWSSKLPSSDQYVFDQGSTSDWAESFVAADAAAKAWADAQIKKQLSAA